ncbi:bifunctional diaminohydroxyphosphoribosylaminopyrimidine deaminase/5-amino-6-(5-phosphoribosylamino)uracil reductase RibD [Corynebacterium sp. CCM 9185]|uniref:Riboflavin biosynthesis protein RibD n=1 Tax=Corynebacterium marambiense TaxID=2765364 RepID=A0ABS0VXB7_9CORY|nr:bifunctional diaminohydroxyphosphoribosylaminopyrimidine deaminase/5-amino-6-(5-phosphoribosylamino)uracil reductase RibD [Corynebacterium marambiense]MBI9001423.1 bifunctional diaminohydroxyphosphoribosylaminopyrimidine deaminase/5-amino-6-(5-phosphoribosylamino)uracil reductase RibD [Corynebacterium marambiense]MCK7664052.1 bifunctional diaminohydroxyphosphoribosylaminopyrimidine deaminase/5-amino-6-(5-phosphoribosylamino)uracil reductase RibD [Corynebacterium marambiense]
MPLFTDLLPDHPISVEHAMRIAGDAAERARGTTRPNPPVGCVILDTAGVPRAVAATEPAGGPHAEAQALAAAGDWASGGHAVVTLEPCHHQGRTPPCTGALVQAGVTALTFAVADPNPIAAGGADWLASRGLDVTRGLLAEATANAALRPWLHVQATGRPHITLKTAATVDGRAAATDGTSQWITGPAARRRVHVDRSRRDAIIVGTGTVHTDDPRLTARGADGTPLGNQPLRVVVGRSDVPQDAAIRAGGKRFLHLPTRDLTEVVAALTERGIMDVLIEGGPRLAGAFLRADLVDAIESYIAPAVLGAGTTTVDTGVENTIAEITRFRTIRVDRLGDDVLIRAVRGADD